MPDTHHRLQSTIKSELERKLAEFPFQQTPTDEIKAYIEGHLETRLSLDDHCDHLARSRRTFSRQLANEGVTYTAIRDEVRAKRAIELMRDQDLPVKQVAIRCDFSGVASFSKAFRNWMGQSPSD